MELFYNKNINSSTNEFKLEGSENNHIYKVLRKKKDETIEFTNGNYLKFKVKIITTSKTFSLFKVLSCKKVVLENKLHIAISLLKSNARFEMFLEKAVEIGISEITPLICERTENKKINLERLNKIMISGIKQSLKYKLPRLNEPVNYPTFMNLVTNENKLIATCEKFKKKHISNSFDKSKFNILLIGPEGDFTQNELNLALENDFQFVSLGDTRLRAETAAIMSCAIFSAIK